MKYNLKQIMNRAWKLRSSSDYLFSECLKEAWKEIKTPVIELNPNKTYFCKTKKERCRDKDYYKNFEYCGLKEDWLNIEFNFENRDFQLLGIRRENKNFPIICKDINSEENFKFNEVLIQDIINNN